MSKLKKSLICIMCISMLFCTLCSTLVYAIDGQYIWTEETAETVANETEKTEEASKENSLKLESGGAILIEQNTGEVLYEHNSHEKLRPASVTKVMTILLIMEAIDRGELKLTDTIPCSENASAMGGSQIWLDTKETLTVDEMLKAICVVSANEYTVQLRHQYKY